MNMKNKHSNLSSASTTGGQTANGVLQFLQSLSVSNLTLDSRCQSLKSVLELITERFSADHAYILFENGNRNGLELFAGTQRNAEDGSASTFSGPLIEKVIRTSQGILVKDPINCEDFSRDPNFQKFNVKSVICVPVNGTITPAGVIYLDSLQEQCHWSEEDLKLLDFVGAYVRLALEVARLRQQSAENQQLITAGQVTRHISHSVKNILQLLTGAAEVIDLGLRTNDIPRVKRSWNILKPSLERIKKFMLDMLDFSRERPLELGPCEFNKVIQSAVDSLSAQLKRKKTKLHICVDRQIPTVELDSERTYKMAANLILNAVDNVDSDTGVVTVETKYLQQKNAVQFSVMDNGPGIAQEAKEKIFLPFQSGRNELATGLGPAIAKNIAEQHRGRIEIESEMGRGTTFRVILPAKLVQVN
jgi:signal transduction histidine kinase